MKKIKTIIFTALSIFVFDMMIEIIAENSYLNYDEKYLYEDNIVIYE